MRRYIAPAVVALALVAGCSPEPTAIQKFRANVPVNSPMTPDELEEQGNDYCHNRYGTNGNRAKADAYVDQIEEMLEGDDLSQMLTALNAYCFDSEQGP